ncbi:MAG: tyrosine-type recombinase/integrase, partial [Endomicrobium sp.]|nr:tyrosine-type recombinase/integrase [Endomicrobium sp.]
LAKIELAKLVEDEDRKRIGLAQKGVLWETAKSRYLQYSQREKSIGTYENEKYVFDDLKKFCPTISNISEFNMLFIESFLTWLRTTKKNSETTLVSKQKILKSFSNKIYDWNLVAKNPLIKLKIKSARNEKEIKYWKNEKEINFILENSKNFWKTINYIGFFIGARISEILSLKWANIDFDENKIKIESEGTFRTKSRKFRVLAMPTRLKDYLLNLKDSSKNDFVIVNSLGHSPSLDNTATALSKLYSKMGFKGYHSHCLRHTFAAHYLKKYKDIYGLSKLLGHHSVAITEKYYGHLVPNYFDATMPNFDYHIEDL